ncbi:MAG: hypothetical protein JKY87_02225 [Mariprofundus sp.]|nr:hypothetical protein [Mariprofundus sp.]
MKKAQYIAVAAALLFSSSAWAAPYTIANTFVAGTQAIAAQVNANFTAAKTAIDDNDTRITANTASAATNATNITVNTASAASNTTDIASNATAITNLQNAALVRTINVSPVIGGGGVIDAVASGTALINAVAAITTSGLTNPFLVKLEPGTFDLGLQMLSLPDSVSLEGSGQGVSIITSAEPGALGPFTAAVNALGNNTISHLTIKNTAPVSGGGTIAPQSLVITSATATSVLIENTGLLSNGGGLIVNGTAAVNVTVRHSEFAAVAPARMIASDSPNAVVLVSHSSQSGVLVGFIVGGGTGSLQCFSVFNKTTLAVASATCQ